MLSNEVRLEFALKDDEGFAERANELRIRWVEKQWEFVVPSTFTTRPDSGLVAPLLTFLNHFFSKWGSKEGFTKPESDGDFPLTAALTDDKDGDGLTAADGVESVLIRDANSLGNMSNT